MSRRVRSGLVLALFLMAVWGAPRVNGMSAVGGAATAARSITVGGTAPDAVVAPGTHCRVLAATVRFLPLAALALCAGAVALGLRGLGTPGLGRGFEDAGDGWRALLIGAPPSFL